MNSSRSIGTSGGRTTGNVHGLELGRVKRDSNVRDCAATQNVNAWRARGIWFRFQVVQPGGTGAGRSRRSVQKRGTARCAQPASRTSAGTICAIRGRAGTCRTGRRCMPCRRWVGWSSMEMVRRYAHLAADHLAPFCRTFMLFACRACGELRHKNVTLRKMKGPASLQALDLLVAGTRDPTWKRLRIK
jgi:hypothetical protein